MTPRHQKWLWLAIRSLVTLGIVGFLFHKVEWAQLMHRLENAKFAWLALAIICFGASAALGAVRWWYLLRVQHIQLRLRIVATLTLIGQFFNSFMFGAMGGDVVKVLYLYRYAPDRKTHATLSVLLDRALGLFILLFASLIVLPWQLASLNSTEAAHAAVAALIIAFAMMIGGGLLVLFTPFHRIPWKLRELWARLPHHRVAELLIQGFRQHKDARALTLGSFAAGTALSLMLVAGGYCIARGINLSVSYLQLLVIITVAICVTSLPVSIGGHGVREGAFVLMFAAFGAISLERNGSEDAILFSVLFFALPLVWSVLGGLLYLTIRHEYELAR